MIFIDFTRKLQDLWAGVPAESIAVVAIVVGLVAVYLVCGSFYEQESE